MSTKRGLGRWEVQAGQGTELMALTDATGLPLAVCAASASPHEVTLVEAALAASFLRERPERLIADPGIWLRPARRREEHRSDRAAQA
jgi:hypothetical protein